MNVTQCSAGSDGAVAAGVAAGLFTGIATSAIANSNNRSASDEEVRQIRREQQQERIDQIRRENEARESLRKDEQLRQLDAHLKNVERQQGSASHVPLIWFMAGLIGVLLMLLFGVVVIFLRQRK